jgi:hypothetical protein
VGESRDRSRRPQRQRRQPQESPQKPGRRQIESITGAQATQALEGHCLGVLLRRPDLLYKVDRHLQEAGLGRLSVDDFQRADHQTIYRLIQISIDQDDTEPLNYVLNRLSLPLMDTADGLLERTTRLDPVEDRVLEDLLRALLDLRRRILHQNLEYLGYQMQEAHQQGDWMAAEHQQSLKQFTTALNRINLAIARYTNRVSFR